MARTVEMNSLWRLRTISTGNTHFMETIHPLRKYVAVQEEIQMGINQTISCHV